MDEFLLTDVGDQELKSSSPDNDVSIVLTSTECNDKTGCECGTQVLLENVCEIVSEHCDTKLGCITPVKPYGHCCWICGEIFVSNGTYILILILIYTHTIAYNTVTMRSFVTEHKLKEFIFNFRRFFFNKLRSKSIQQ